MDIQLQGSVYQLLAAGSPGYTVYDDVPQDATFPYVAVGETIVTQLDTDDTDVIDVNFVIHTYSRYDGSFELKTIQEDVYNKLHRATLSVTGHSFVGCTFQSASSFLDEDGRTRHGIQEFRIILDRN